MLELELARILRHNLIGGRKRGTNYLWEEGTDSA
jgi:hypothetical protein